MTRRRPKTTDPGVSIEIRLEPPVGADVPQTWYFTFGTGQRHAGCFVRFEDVTWERARELMIERFDREWAFQYSEADWVKDGTTEAERWGLVEITT